MEVMILLVPVANGSLHHNQLVIRLSTGQYPGYHLCCPCGQTSRRNLGPSSLNLGHNLGQSELD